MNVGVVLCLPEALTVLGRANVQWEPWRSTTNAVVAGPISAAEYTTFPVAFKASDTLPGSVTLYLGANRGRGQAYPNGAASNLVSSRWLNTGLVNGRCYLAKRLGVRCWTLDTSWRLHTQLVGAGHAIRPTSGIRGSCDEGGVVDVVVNGGGFGQTEEQLVVQSEPRMVAGLAFMLLGTNTQLALCLKKKQYERWRLAQPIDMDVHVGQQRSRAHQILDFALYLSHSLTQAPDPGTLALLDGFQSFRGLLVTQRALLVVSLRGRIRGISSQPHLARRNLLHFLVSRRWYVQLHPLRCPATLGRSTSANDIPQARTPVPEPSPKWRGPVPGLR